MFVSGLPIDGDMPTDAASLEEGYASKTKAERDSPASDEEPAFLDDESPSNELPSRITLPQKERT